MPKKKANPKKPLPPGWVQSTVEWPGTLRDAAKAMAKIDGSRTLTQFIRNAVKARVKKFGGVLPGDSDSD